MNATSNLYGTRKGGALVNARNEYLPEGYFYTSLKRDKTDPEHEITAPKDGPGFTRLALELEARKARTSGRQANAAAHKRKVLAAKNAKRAAKGLPPMPVRKG